ncbi:hypothetical protein ACSQ67_013194 [Phaseolus vulgaris]
MPRRSSGVMSIIELLLMSAGRSARSASRPAPRPVNSAPPPAPVQSGNRGGSLFGTVAEGMAFGGGVAVVNRALDSALGPRTIQHETVTTGPSTAVPAATANSFGSDACNMHSKSFQDCLNSYGDDISKCQFYMESLAECRRNSGATFNA